MPNLEYHRLFVQTLQALLQAQQEVSDIFFNRRLSNAIASVIESHIRYHGAKKDHAQEYAQASKEYIQSWKSIDHLLEEIMYVNESGRIALAIARERLLYYLREMILESKSVKISVAEAAPSVAPQAAVEVSQTRPLKSINHINPTHAKILEFIRRAPERRPKEIIDEFSALSGRTIKRGLKELSREGFIVKKSENRAVYYSAV